MSISGAGAAPRVARDRRSRHRREGPAHPAHRDRGRVLRSAFPADAGVYTAFVTTPCGPFTSQAFTVTNPCAADFNGDGALNSQDYFDFLAAFFAENPASDFNHDGILNSQDYFDFLNAFFNGC